jgi:hypothetical protein
MSSSKRSISNICSGLCGCVTKTLDGDPVNGVCDLMTSIDSVTSKVELLGINPSVPPSDHSSSDNLYRNYLESLYSSSNVEDTNNRYLQYLNELAREAQNLIVSIKSQRSAVLSAAVIPPPQPLTRYGIESNPGPPKRKLEVVVKTSNKRQKVVHNPLGKKRSHPSSGQRRKHRVNFNTMPLQSRNTVQSAHPTINNYISTLMDPWFCPPVKLGFGTFSASSLRTCYRKGAFTVGNNATDFAIGLNLNQITTNNACFPTVSQGAWVNFSDFPNANSQIGYGNDKASFATANSTTIVSTSDSYRTISSALRVTIRYAATALRGMLAGLYVPDDTPSALAGMTVSQVIGLNNSRLATSSAGGEITIEVQYRPIDSSSYQFISLVGQGVTVPQPQLVVVGTGWLTNTYAIEYEIIQHIETLSGLDTGGDDSGSTGDSLASTGVTIDQAGQAAITSAPTVITSSAMLDSINLAISNIYDVAASARDVNPCA